MSEGKRERERDFILSSVNKKHKILGVKKKRDDDALVS